MNVLILLLTVCGAPYQVIWADETGQAGHVSYHTFMADDDAHRGVKTLWDNATAKYVLEVSELMGGQCA